MSDFSQVALGLFAALAPFGVLHAFAGPSLEQRRGELIPVLLGVALATIGVAFLVEEPFLDWLAISPESFRTAAGVVMLPLALRLLWSAKTAGDQPATGPALWPALALVPIPVVFVAALSYCASYAGDTVVPAAIAALLVFGAVLITGAWLKQRIGSAGTGVLGRASGALLVVIAVQLIIEGTRSV